MRYEKITIAVVAFAAGYMIRSLLTPTPQDLMSKLEKEIIIDPINNEQMINRTNDANQTDVLKENTRLGYVPFQNLKLVKEEQPEGSIAVLVNQLTGEELPVQYIYGRTAVGSYKGRLVSVLEESHKKAAESVEPYIPKDPATKKLRNTKEYILEKTRNGATNLYENIRGLFTAGKQDATKK